MAKTRKSRKAVSQNSKHEEQQFYKIAIGVTLVVLIIMYFVFKNTVG